MIDAETATTVAPWWGVPLIAGLFAILGVVGTQVVTWRLDRRKAERDNEARWLAERRQIYAAFLAITLDFGRKIWDTWREAPDPVVWVSEENEMNRRRSEVHLIASTGVNSATDKIFDILWDTAGQARTSGGATNARDAFMTRFADAYEDFIEMARQELGVTT